MPKRTPSPKKRKKRFLEKNTMGVSQWQKWGPYVAERSWGTVREDYSADGNAWAYFPFDMAHKRAYRWGEDGLAGFCDRYQILTLTPAFWNGQDPILKERLFGLTSLEGNHGEDVKECYYYLDGVPSHTYMKYLYKYPHEEFPYQKLREENKKRQPQDGEYELIDTGIFDGGKYFDIFIEYAKKDPEDLCIKIEIFNRGIEPAPLHLLFQLTFRNQWSWGDDKKGQPKIYPGCAGTKEACLIADEDLLYPPENLPFTYKLGKRYLYGPKGAQLLFTSNETKNEDKKGFYKDAFHEYIIQKKKVINPEKEGTKAALYYPLGLIEPKKKEVLLFRFSPQVLKNPLKEVEGVIEKRKKQADQFYKKLSPSKTSLEEKKILRQALAGLLWNKQIYLYDVNQWLNGDNKRNPPPESRLHIRNTHWRHLNSMRILYVPDKWEYPWFASWDHAFHCVSLSLIDIAAAKEQLWLLLFDQFQHPNGQIPAYEWEFSDMNPPVQAWTALHLYNKEKKQKGHGDKAFLERCFHKLLMNFSWWVNKVDSSGKNIFEGGFLGLDNIALWNRSEKLPGNGRLLQSDGTGWMAVFCLNLMRMALELASDNPVYEGLATKFFEHYVYIAHAMQQRQNLDYELWSEKEGFFYDVLTYPDRHFEKLRVRSIVGIIPLFCVDMFSEDTLNKHKEFKKNFLWFLKNRPNLVEDGVTELKRNNKSYYLFTPVSSHQLKKILGYIVDEKEFCSPFGLRSLSKYHEISPFSFAGRKISYEPAESLEKIKGGNSNWRGPVWLQVNFMLIESLRTFDKAFKDALYVVDTKGRKLYCHQIADLFVAKILQIFKKDRKGKRPYLGEDFPYHSDPLWSEHLLFHEYFNPETGKGMGASHQTGWTALVANLIKDFC